MYIWNTVIVVTKLMFYLGFAATAGYTFFWRDINDNSTNYTTPSYSAVWVKVCVFVAFISNAVWFIANTGAMVEEGIQGALDPFMLKIMLSSPIGEVTLYRAGGLAVALITIYLLKFKPLKSNNIRANLINFYNLIVLYIGSLNINNTQFQVTLILVNVLVYIFVYLKLFNKKYNTH